MRIGAWELASTGWCTGVVVSEAIHAISGRRRSADGLAKVLLGC